MNDPDDRFDELMRPENLTAPTRGAESSTS